MFLGLKGAKKLCLYKDGQLIPSSKHVKLLGVNIGNSLKFETHVKEIWKKVNQKVYAFGRLRPYLGEPKSKLLLNSVAMSNFSYCPLIWLFCSKVANNETNRTHKSAMRTLDRDYESTSEELLDRGDTKTTHKKNLENLMMEIYKSKNHLNPECMWDFFVKKDVPYNLRTNELCKLPSVSSQRYGINSLSSRRSLLWNALSDDLKLKTSLVKFKKEIRCWDGNNCTCYICT